VSETQSETEVKMFQGEAALPFVLERVEEADQILVNFPAYHTGVVEPSTWQRGKMSQHKAHRLFIGSDQHTYWGPAQELRGLRTAVRLIEKTADELGVPPERVVCFGTSMAAALAALTGLAYGAGGVILGAPPLAMGTLLGGWATQERREGGKPMTSAIRLFALAERDGGPDPVEWLDGLIPSLAADCPNPCKVRLFASPHDFVFPGVERFYEQRDSFPNVDVEVELLPDAPTHDAVAKAFYLDYLPRALSEELAPA
jgi:hypothetical protein